jgi:hypothetical protein
MGVSHNVKYIHLFTETEKFFYMNLIHYTTVTLTGIRFGGMDFFSYICISN